MDNSVTTFILVIATIFVGIAIFGLFSAYYGINATQINQVKNIQQIASEFQVRLIESQISNSETSFIVIPYIPNYKGTLYVSGFLISSQYVNSQPVVTPNLGQGFININGTSPVCSGLVNVQTDSDTSLYYGQTYTMVRSVYSKLFQMHLK
ncbi:hypothetical protein [Sulfolobus acidocaldarius]|uniref:hypothetical protein n=1 Tax=Sulfolobus acidocaldarius TaxID=2285 RepID=UPI000A9FBBE7|nr:hypothetical protein [Sulfolobus acidocaldarius]